MCGLVGICGPFNQNRNWLSLANDKLFHRGPDGSGEWWSPDGRVGLAHRRLSILDLTSLGSQPMHLMDLGLTIVFNGEIYNYKELYKDLVDLGFSFRSQSDTEVLLTAYAAWGENCLTKINGMFSFAIYDIKLQKLFLARDRAGEKPLFYHFLNGKLQFASELKALLTNPDNPRKVDTESLDCYLAMGYVPGDRCILQGYNKLPPAHALTFDLISSQLNIWRYWMLPEFEVSNEKIDEIKLIDEFEALLENSVKRQMVADVPVGVFLSGGVDSSLITAMAVRSSQKVQTFTIGFPGDGKLDESDHARKIASHFGTQHHELMASDISAYHLYKLAEHFDEPIVDSSIIPMNLVCQLVNKHCTVALGGDGGDELFGGYVNYKRLILMQQLIKNIPLSLRRCLGSLADNFLPIGFKGRNLLKEVSSDLIQSLPIHARFFDINARRNLFLDKNITHNYASNIFGSLVPLNSDILQRATRMDFHNYLAEDILVKIDRVSMMNSLEVRAPFLDYRLIEFAFKKVPSYLKANQLDQKILLKKLSARILPSGFDLNRKQGFSIPLSEWLKKGSFRNLFHDVLRDKNCSFNRTKIDELLCGQYNGRSNSERLFALVLFEIWRKEYKVVF